MKKPHERSNEIFATKEVVDFLQKGICPRCEVGEIAMAGRIGYQCAVCERDFTDVPEMKTAVIVLPSIVIAELNRREMFTEALNGMKEDIEQVALVCPLTPDQAFKMYEYFREKLEHTIGVPLL